jgi:hypothetical protein
MFAFLNITDRLKFLAVKYNSENYWTAYKTSRNHITSTLREAQTAYIKQNLKVSNMTLKKLGKPLIKSLTGNKNVAK